MEASFDVVVIGAGLSGIIAAQRFLQVHPETNLTILERDSYVGGVWNKERIYPSFWSQWTHGMAEFSDMPMERPPDDDCMYDLFPAKYSMMYFERYVDEMTHAGRTLRERIQLNTEVKSIKKLGGRWQILCAHDSNGNQPTIYCSRIMLANGESSVPNMPNLPGSGTFSGKIVHSIEYGTSNVISDKHIQHVAVLGAGKCAADMVYEAVKAGKTVSWIIRRSEDGGLGPAALAPIDLPTPYKNGVEASQARIMASLQPSFWIPNRSWWTWLLHSTSLGAKLVGGIFALLDETVRKSAGYREKKSDKGFDKLEYDTEIFWQNGTAGGCHFRDFWSLVAEKVFVYRADVKLITKRELYLNDDAGTHFPCDALLCGTGWKQGLEMFDIDTCKNLGLPYPKNLQPQEEAAKWEKIVGDADEDILKRFILLRNPPEHTHKYETRTPYRLYQNIVPLHDDSILFMNHLTVGTKLYAAEAQAIWAVAYWDKSFKRPSLEEMERDVAHMIAWNKRRYLSKGELGNFAAFDTVPYVDRLFDEIGATAHRKKGWLGNMFSPVLPTDIGNVWREYLAREGKTVT